MRRPEVRGLGPGIASLLSLSPEAERGAATSRWCARVSPGAGSSRLRPGLRPGGYIRDSVRAVAGVTGRRRGVQRLVRVQETQRFGQESPSLFPHSHPVPGRWRWPYLTTTPLPRSRSFVRHRRGRSRDGAEMSSRPGTAREPDPSLSPAITAFLTVPAERPASVSAQWQLCFCSPARLAL